MEEDEEVPVPPQHVAFRPPPIEKRSVVLTANSKTAMVHPARPAGAGNPLIKRKRARDESDDDDADAMDRGTAADTVQPHKRRVYAGGDAKAANLGKASNRNWKAPAKPPSSHIVRNDAQLARAAWDKKMAAKRSEKEVRKRISEIKRTELDKVKTEKKRREDLKKQKEQNRKKATIVQKVTNSKKLKAMSKKAQKGVRFVKEVV